MSAVPKNTFILLVVVALVAGAWPAVLLGGIDLDPRVESCAGPDNACCGDEEAGAGSQPKADDCCPSGCNECYLACCAGMVSLLPNVVIVASSECTVPIVCPPHGDPSLACEREIDHPPRA